MEKSQVVQIKYCTKCGNTGVDINNKPCTCRINVQSFYDSVSCLDIPEQYRGVCFNRGLVPNDVDDGYATFLDNIRNDVVAGRLPDKNIIICSPINHSKSILAYNCMEVLFRNGIPIFPLFDVLELKRIITDFDLGRKQAYDVIEPERIVSVPLLFVKVPRITSWEIYDSIALILDRRVRRGNTTIFLYDGYWNHLVSGDKQNILTGLLGNGFFNTIYLSNWSVSNATESLPEIKLRDNIG